MVHEQRVVRLVRRRRRLRWRRRKLGLDARREQFGTGFGAILLPDWEARPSLRLVAQVCLKAFGGDPRVWGDPERTVNRIAFLNGSWNEPELYDVCVRYIAPVFILIILLSSLASVFGLLKL